MLVANAVLCKPVGVTASGQGKKRNGFLYYSKIPLLTVRIMYIQRHHIGRSMPANTDLSSCSRTRFTLSQWHEQENRRARQVLEGLFIFLCSICPQGLAFEVFFFFEM